ncbi:Z1 domain-containing protein [Spiroplasma sp. DGKH1]|uniref:Z1 domain-containing protein n=1 Tax=Spiroplasma sp. DGKH1 TaxID=3050074 RepID=UPI0034C5E23A
MTKKIKEIQGFIDNKTIYNLDVGLNNYFINNFYNKIIEDINNNKYDRKYFSQLQNNLNRINVELKDYKHESAIIVGEVQSGKTNNIIGAVCQAMDLNYDLIILLGGTNNNLLEQFKARMYNTFENRKSYFKLETSHSEIEFSNHMKNNERVIILSLKEDDNLEKIYREIEFSEDLLKNKKILLIDDECDYATVGKYKKSPNINNESNHKYFKRNYILKWTKIYELINNILIKSSGKYLGITATPYANIIAKHNNFLWPRKILKLESSENYTGIDFFKKNSYCYKIIEKKDIQSAVKYFLVVSSILKYIKYKFNNFQMLINCDSKNSGQESIKSSVTNLINHLNKIMNIKIFKTIIDEVIEDGAFLKTLVINCNIQELYDIAKKNLADMFENIDIWNQNYENKIKESNLQIIIGSTLISRGYTFPNLLVEVITLSRQQKQPIDTLLQRARWFGYRKDNNFYKFMKIFMTQQVYKNYEEAYFVNYNLYNNILSEYVIENSINIIEKIKDYAKTYKTIKLTDKE